MYFMRAYRKLGTMFALLLSLVFIAGMIVSGIILWNVLEQRSEAEIAAKAGVLLDTVIAARNYVSNHFERQSTDFAAQAVPAFAAKEIFEDFHKQAGYEDFLYKEAALNPTNVRDTADSFETELINRFRHQAGLSELSGFRTRDGQQIYYLAHPLVVTQSCLVCHGSPASAPTGLVAAYGTAHGFGWRVGDVAAETIYVPANDVVSTTLHLFLMFIGIFSVVFAVLLFLITMLLRWYVIHPVSVMGELAQKVSDDKIVVDELDSEHILRITQRPDELGQLARVFHNMACEVIIRMDRLKQQVQQLRIEIDEQKRQHEVAEIVESDAFRNIQARARMLRNQHHEDFMRPPKPPIEPKASSEPPPLTTPVEPEDDPPKNGNIHS
jgi:hypothetical protein